MKVEISENISLKVEDTDGTPPKKRAFAGIKYIPQVISKIRRRRK